MNSRAPPTNSQLPPTSTKNLVQAEAASEKMSISIAPSASVTTTSAAPPTFSQRPPSPRKTMMSSQKIPPAIKSGPLTSTTRPKSPVKRPAESELNPPAKRIFPKWDPQRDRSTAQQSPKPPIDTVDPPPSSTAPSPLSRSLADQLNPPHKRPAPVAPSSPRKKHLPTTGLPGLSTISAAPHAPSQEAQPRSLSQTSSIKASVRSAVDLPKTPTTPTFRSPRKAPAPPTEQQSREKTEEPTKPPLSADDMFAVGFPTHFGPQETVGGHHPVAKATSQPSTRLPVAPNPFTLPALSRGNSPAPTFGTTAWAKPEQFGFGKPSFPQQPSLTPPPNPPPPRSPPPFPTTVPSPPSTTRSSLPIASLSTLRQLGLPPDRDDDSSDDENYPYKSKTVADFQRALRASAPVDERGAAEEEVEEDSDIDSDDDGLDYDDDDNPPPPTIHPPAQGTPINTPPWTTTQSAITGTGEAWTRPGGAGVSTRGRASSPLEELAGEGEGEGEGEYDDDASLYPDRAAGQEQEDGGIDYLFDDEDIEEGGVEEGEIDSLFDDVEDSMG
ncbi:MAG: hypothetical protein Q9195_008428 [Heterodermia aff. obscurata]